MEKRKLVRFRAPCYIKVSLPRVSSNFSCVGKDISMKGAGLIVEKEDSFNIKPDDSVSLCIFLHQKRLCVHGKLVWAKEYSWYLECGVYFINIKDEYKQAIFDYVFKYYPQELTRRWWSS